MYVTGAIELGPRLSQGVYLGRWMEMLVLALSAYPSDKYPPRKREARGPGGKAREGGGREKLPDSSSGPGEGRIEGLCFVNFPSPFFLRGVSIRQRQ